MREFTHKKYRFTKFCSLGPLDSHANNSNLQHSWAEEECTPRVQAWQMVSHRFWTSAPVTGGAKRCLQAARSAICHRFWTSVLLKGGAKRCLQAARSAARAILVVMRLSCKKILIKWGPSRQKKTLICFSAYEFIAPPHPPSSMLWCKVRGCGRSRKNAHFCLRLVSSTPSTLKLGVRGGGIVPKEDQKMSVFF